LMRRAEGENLSILCLPKIEKKYFLAYWAYDFTQPKAQILRLALCARIASALARLHSTGAYVLYDIKPENILVAADGSIYLIDTDNAQIAENGQLLFAAKSATPDYTPPECYHNAQSGIIDVAWDNFSMAAVFYKVLCGLPSHAGTTADERIVGIPEMIRYGLFPKGKNARHFRAIPALHERFDQLPKAVQALFLRAFDEGHTQPKRRPSASEWRDTLSPYLSEAAAYHASQPQPSADLVATNAAPAARKKTAPKISEAAARSLTGKSHFWAITATTIAVVFVLLFFAVMMLYNEAMQPIAPTAAPLASADTASRDTSTSSRPTADSSQSTLKARFRRIESYGLYGYADSTGRVIIPCAYSYASDFDEKGIAHVSQNNSFFYIDTNNLCVRDCPPHRLYGARPNESELNIELIEVQGGKLRPQPSADSLSAQGIDIAPFFIGKYEITQQQWQHVMGYDKKFSYFCPSCPADNISFSDAQAFIARFNQRTGKRYRLPAEAEWEYAASGGVRSYGTRYAGSNQASRVAIYAQKYAYPVGKRTPNELLIYDMSGNVAEWCADTRRARGGAWDSPEGDCEIAKKTTNPNPRSIGFRVALSR